MEKIPFLLRKLQELQDLPFRKTRIDIDLMLDYSRKLYGELLDLRDAATASHPSDPEENGSLRPAAPAIPAPQEQAGEPLHTAVAGEAVPMSTIAHQMPREPLHTVAGEAATPVREAFPPDPEAPPAGDDSGTGPVQPSDNQAMSGNKTPDEPVRQSYESAQPAPAHRITPAPPSAPKKDIRKSIGINDKYQIISELFHNDKEAYETAINEINNSENATGAIDWLHDHVAWNYNWSEDNYTVQLFYGLISQHFKHQAG